MNYYDLQYQIWNALGIVDAGAMKNRRRQQIRDGLNTALLRIATAAPYTCCLWREFAINIIPGQTIYKLNDWVLRPTEFFTRGVSSAGVPISVNTGLNGANLAASGGHWVRYRSRRTADRTGLRNVAGGGGILGPWDITGFQRSTAAAKSGASGPTTGASAAEGQNTVTINSGAGSANLPSAATDIGLMLKLNGEYGDYMITNVNGLVYTVDRPIKSRCPIDDNTSGVGSGYTNVRWEVSPRNCFQVEMLPIPTTASVLPYRAACLPRKLLNDDECPEIQDEYHHLVYKGGMVETGLFNEDSDNYGAWKQEYEQALTQFRKDDQDDQDSEDPPDFDRSLGDDVRGLPNDVLLPRTWGL